jgi:ABC-2 type transport system permease protein
VDKKCDESEATKMNVVKVLKGLYALWYREFKVFIREKSRVISSIVSPLFFMLVFGGGLGSIASIPGMSYQTFIYPGFLGMIVLFTSISFGTYIVMDKKIDFLKEVLVTPLSRTTIFVGKVIGGMTDSMIQATFLILIGFLLNVPFTYHSILLTFVILALFSAAMVSLALFIGSFMESPQGFGIISSFIIFPMFLLSGAFYPLTNLPSWMAALTHIDPMTYAVDGLRGVILGTSYFSFTLDLSVLVGFATVMIILGTWSFNRMRV